MVDIFCWLHPRHPLAQELRPADQTHAHMAADGCWGLTSSSAAGNGPWAAIAGHPIWRDAELAGWAAAHGDAHALLEAHRRHGRDLLGRLGGGFAWVILDPAREQLIAAVDRLGQETLYFSPLDDGLAVATRAGLLRRHPAVDDSLDPQAIHDYLYFHMIPAPGTIHAGMHKLQPAQVLAFTQRHLSVERYWTPAFREDATDWQASGEALRTTLETAVGRHIDAGRTASFLSGGLDSSTVTGLHARLEPGGAHAYGIGFNQPGYDEIPFARRAAHHFGVPLTEYYVTSSDVADTITRIARAYDEPFGNSSALPAFFCARTARENGVTRLLAGDGGDELFAGNARYAKQQIFELYGGLPRGLRHRLIEPLATSRAAGLRGLRKLRSYVEQARMPLPDRMESYNFLHRIDPAEIFEPDFLAAINRDRPIEQLREIYQTPADASALNRMMYLDWQITLADNDLRKVTETCRLAGIDVVFPMLDDDVVELSCRIPTQWKLRRGRLRHFYKEAFRGFLPDETLNKRKHGFGLPFGLWLRDDPTLHDLARDCLHALRDSGWLRADFLDRLFDHYLETHPAYYGDFVWVLMTLAIWLEDRQVHPMPNVRYATG